ncbi:MAG: Lpg1974 family pore-forming outer membrane protein [Chlamydiae bacterium]|nr:Lpg1974 family pore-forming outer membrane protein [Chlamydiota bacterium]
MRKPKQAIINPHARPTQKDSWGGFLTGDILLWEAHENNLAFAVEQTSDAGRKARNLNFHWDWGFRLGIGANLPHDGWDVYLNWTRFYTNGSRKISSTAFGGFIPTYIPPAQISATTRSQQIDANWKLHFNQLVLELGREFFVSRWLTLRPCAGFITDWIHQRYKIKYRDLMNFTFGSRADIEMKCKYWGLGLRGGIDTEWGVGAGFGIFANLYASLLYGYFSTGFDEFTANNSPLLLFKDHHRIGRAITDLMLGLRYDYLFCNERYHIGLQVGWEHHMFFGLNQFPRFVDDLAVGTFLGNQGDLTIQGYILQIRLDF